MINKILDRNYIHKLYMNINTSKIIIIDDNSYSLTFDENTDSSKYIIQLDYIEVNKPMIKSYKNDNGVIIIGVNKIGF